MTDRTVYFLGAGASADAGVPLTNELLRHVARNARRSKSLAPLAKFIDTFDYARSQHRLRPPIVDAVSLLDSCIQQDRPLDRYFTIDRLRRVRQLLVIELARVCKAAPEGNVPRAGASIGQETLGEPASEHGIASGRGDRSPLLSGLSVTVEGNRMRLDTMSETSQPHAAT